MIVMEGISKRFGAQTVLDGIDLAVQRGTIFALLGPNGAGKTTLINILSTLVAPDAGNARIAGLDVVAHRDAVRATISVTGQSATVDEKLTGIENLRMMAALSGLGKKRAGKRIEELLAAFDLEDSAKKKVAAYSGGMRRRLDLAISLLLTPPVIFLDEPTTGLDTRSRHDLWTVIRSLAANGTTVFLTTQYLEEADQLADRLAVLDHGRIVAQGTPGELKERVGGDVLGLHGSDGSIVREIPTDGTVGGLRAALALVDDADAASISLRRPSLDDVFLAVTEPANRNGLVTSTGARS